MHAEHAISAFWQHFANNGNDVARPELAATAAATMGGTAVAAVTTPTSRGRDRRAKRARGLAGGAVVLTTLNTNFIALTLVNLRYFSRLGMGGEMRDLEPCT